jgi:DNA modification methylase
MIGDSFELACDREDAQRTSAAEAESHAEPLRIRDRIRELRRVPARTLLPNPKNWRRHSKAQAEAWRGLLTQIGYAGALLVRELADGRLMLIDGHLRAQTTPEAMVPVLLLDVTEAEADLILATFDPLGAMAESDAERYSALLETARSDDQAVQDLLRRTAGEPEWEILHPQEINEAEVSPDRADELRAKWQTAPGQLWTAGPHRIICGDSRDQQTIACLWPDVGPLWRMIWTDPPYGVSYGEKTDWNNQHRGSPRRRAIENDSLKPTELQKLFAAALALAREHAAAGAAIYATVPSVFLKYFIQAFEDGGFSYRHCLVWIKQSFVLGRSDYNYRHEPILYGWAENGAHYFTEDRTQDSVFEVNRPMVSELHPTTKPVELIARMIVNSSRPGELIYDPFGGSGSTILAAHQLGRIAYACEIDPGYVAVELERLSLLGLEPKLESK